MTEAAGHALVTGGGSGIGRAIALALCEAGHQVTITGRNLDRLDAVRAENPAIRAVRCDVQNELLVSEAVARATDLLGSITILINCAGSVQTATFDKTANTVWNDLWQTNVMGAVNTIRAVLPGMRSLNAGRIINIASTASLKGYAYVSAYTATKHALLGMTRALAMELAKTGITVNAICPGYSNTDIIRAATETIVRRTGRSREQALANFTSVNPQARLIDPEEVAAAVLWLLSVGARSVTGQAIVVAGGEVM